MTTVTPNPKPCRFSAADMHRSWYTRLLIEIFREPELAGAARRQFVAAGGLTAIELLLREGISPGDAATGCLILQIMLSTEDTEIAELLVESKIVIPALLQVGLVGPP